MICGSVSQRKRARGEVDSIVDDGRLRRGSTPSSCRSPQPFRVPTIQRAHSPCSSPRSGCGSPAGPTAPRPRRTRCWCRGAPWAGRCRGRCSRPSGPSPLAASTPPGQTRQTAQRGQEAGVTSVGASACARQSCRSGAVETGGPWRCCPARRRSVPHLAALRSSQPSAPALNRPPTPTRSSRRSFSVSTRSPICTRSTPACWQVGITSISSSEVPGNRAATSSRCRRGHSAGRRGWGTAGSGWVAVAAGLRRRRRRRRRRSVRQLEQLISE